MSKIGKGGTFDGGDGSGDWGPPSSTVIMVGAAKKKDEAVQKAADTFMILPFEKKDASAQSLEKEAANRILGGQALDGMLGKVVAGEPIPQVVITGERPRHGAHKVFLRELDLGGSVVYFEVLPEIAENHTTEYEAVATSQSPGAFQKYKGTSTTTWVVNATFIARTSAEATQNLKDLRTLRGWMKPFYGDRTGNDYPGKLGAPPPVLMFGGLRDLIGPVPVVITSMNFNWPKDVDYLATEYISETDGKPVPFPAVLQLPLTLTESYSIEQFNSFSLEDYRSGILRAAFNRPVEDMQIDMTETDAMLDSNLQSLRNP